MVKADNRDSLRDFLIKNEIECGLHYKPNHLLTKYRTNFNLPVTEEIYDQLLTLPCHVDLEKIQQDYVIDKIKKFYGT